MNATITMIRDGDTRLNLLMRATWSLHQYYQSD